MESGEPKQLAEASSLNCNSGVWGWVKESGRREAKSMYSPQTILLCMLWSSGWVRLRGEADPSRNWVQGCTAAEAQLSVGESEAEMAACTDSCTVS